MYLSVGSSKFSQASIRQLPQGSPGFPFSGPQAMFGEVGSVPEAI